MQIDDAGLVEAAVQLVNIISELHAVVSDDVRSTTDGSGSEVAMFCDFVAGACDNEAGGS